jgi:LPXTG-motif cell wall-anchored protein
VAAASAQGQPAELAATGANTLGVLGLGLAALLVGTAAVVLSKHRSTTS